MAKIFGWDPTTMREREDAFAAAVDTKITLLGRQAVSLLNQQKVVTAAGSSSPMAPVDLGEMAALTGMWKGYVSAELMPMLSDVYLESASVIWQGIEEAFDDFTPDAVSDTFAEDYLASASNRLVGIGDHVWTKVREELLVGFSLGESATKLANRVQAAAQVSQMRANVIARTEANMAANAGSFQQVLVSGLTGIKEWLDTNDERTRCTHKAAGGQTVDILTPFTLGGGDCGEGLSYLMMPGDVTAPPSEIIQCRCSMAFDLSLDESVVTAAGEVNSGGMIALMPAMDDANALALDVDGAEPASELHTTLLFLGEASEWGFANRQLLTSVVAEIVEKYVTITTETFSVNIFNPRTDDFNTAVVLGVRGTDLLVALHKSISENITDVFDDEVPEQHTPWVPHITLAYSDDMSVVKQAMKKLGPVTFDRVRVVFGGEITDYPLGVQDPDDPVVAAGKKQFKPSEHPRDHDGKFTKSPSTEGIVSFLKDETDDLPFDFEEKKTLDLDLDAVPPSTKGKKGTKTKYPDPEGKPSMLIPAADPGKSGDGYVKKTDGSKGPWGKYGASGVMLRHRGEDGVDRYLLVQRGKGLSSNVGKWQLPGGGIDSNETPFQGAAREVIEELGFKPEDVAKGRVHGFHEVEVPDTGGWKYTSIAATVPDQLVPDLSGENAQLETGDAKWLTLDEIQALDDNGDLLGPLAGGQWKESIVDLFPPDVKTPEVPGSVPGGVDDVLVGDFSKLKKVSGAKGSNEGGIYEAPDGSRWYVKAQKDSAHAENERLASALYREAGIDVPEVIVGFKAGVSELGKGPQTATRIVPEGTAKLSTVVKHLDSDALLAAREGFAVDALLANWDVAGLTYDNIIFDEQGKPHRIDVGGALEFRAQGTPKGNAFGTDVVEWDTLRDPKKNPQSAKLFAGLSDSELAKAVEHVEQLTPEKIRAIVKDKKLADKLIARRENLLKRAEQEGVLSAVTGDVGFHPVTDHQTEDDDIIIGDEIDTDVSLSPTDAFKQHMASKVDTPLTLDDVPTLSGDVYDYSGTYQEDLWDQTIGGEFLSLGQGDVILKGASLDSKGNPLQVVVRFDPVTGAPYLQELEYDQVDDKWFIGRTWHSEDEFIASDLSEYDINKKSSVKTPADMGIDTSNGLIPVDPVHPGPFSTSGAPHVKLWNQVGQGKYASGHAVAGGYNPQDASYHRLVAQMSPTGQWYLEDQVEDENGKFLFIQSYASLAEFGQADYSWMGIGKPMTPPGPVKSVTTPSSVPSVAPKKVPKLTNAIIYGKYQNGEVIATLDIPSGKPLERLVYKNNKIVTQQQSVSGDWIDGDSYGKAEAYKKFNKLGPWFLGAVAPAGSPIVVTPMTEVKPTKGLSLAETIQQGQYQNGDVVATYTKPGSSGQTQMIFSGGIFIKQNRSNDSSPWKNVNTYADDEAVLASIAKGSGTWTKADEPSGGLKPPPKPPAELTPTVATSFKKTFDDQGVKWHTSADQMLKALSDALKTHPDFTMAQVLAYMDTTTKTKTSPTPFTDKVAKYLKTKNGVAIAKSLGLPVTKTKSTPSYVTPTAPKTPGPVHVGPTVFIHDEPHIGPTSAPGTYKIQGVTGMNIIHNNMMAQHGMWTPAQKSAISSYTGSGYSAMNGCLRKPATCTPAVKKRNAELQAAMRPTTAPLQVTRGAGWSSVGLPSSSGMSDKERIQKLQELEGKILQEPGFLSTSAKSTPAFSGKPVKFIIDVPTGTPGAWVYTVSVHKSEEEFLLAAGLKYRVKKVIPSSGYGKPTTVHLEVIPS